MTVTARELAHDIAARYGYTRKDAKEFVRAFIHTLTDHLRQGDTVRLYGFGNFFVIDHHAQRVYNFQTGGIDDTLPHRIVKFKPSNALKAVVRSSEWEDMSSDVDDDALFEDGD